MRYKQTVRRHAGGNLIEEKGEEEEEETREIEGQKTGRITVMYVGKTGIGPKTATTEQRERHDNGVNWERDDNRVPREREDRRQ